MIHVVVAFVSAIAVIVNGDIKNWEKFHSTIWFFIGGNLLYNFVCANYWLWQFNIPHRNNHIAIEVLYTFIVFPATLIMFMNNYPKTYIKKIFHYILWCGLYIVIEFFYQLKGYIIYHNGWNLGWSFLFVLFMFPILRLHHKSPLLAYVLSVPIIVLVIWFFNVPFTTPIEDR